MSQIGKSGMNTSFIVKTRILKKLVRGGGCQEKNNDEIDSFNTSENKQWLKLSQIIQNVIGKGIATLIGKIEGRTSIVKVQLHNEAAAEYEIQEHLKDINGFIKYTCYFTCSGDKKYIETFAIGTDLSKKSRLCLAKGDNMGIIIMPYFKNGSLENYLKSSMHSKSQIKNILVYTVGYIYNAFLTHGFTHGDLFTKNIVLNDEFKPIIIDFEKSSFNNEKLRFWLDLDDLLNDVARFAFNQELVTVSRDHVTMNRAYNRDPSDETQNLFLKALLRLK